MQALFLITFILCGCVLTQKLGNCPSIQEGTFGICLESCSSDDDCSGSSKCCSTGCGRTCTEPQAEQQPDENVCADGSAPVNCLMAPCTSSQCDVAGATCTDNYCGGCNAIWTDATGTTVCNEKKPATPPITKPGNCPTPTPGVFGTCSEDCSSDSDCTGNNKCCSNGCGKACLAPNARVNACADGSAPVNCLMAPCTTSKCDVAGATCADNYCGGCNAVWTDATGLTVCHEKKVPTPTSTKKPGNCPAPTPGVFGTCSEDCSSDSDCSDNNKCCSNGCGKSCLAPEPGSDCTKGVARCLVAPCTVSKCDVAGAQCADNYCGGCHAIWTDANGQRVCNATDPKPTPTKPTTKPKPRTKRGNCPTIAAGTIGSCAISCSSDSDCSGYLKCCSNGCGRSCQKAATTVKKPTLTCSNILCIAGQECVNTASGPRCIAANTITQAAADSTSTYDSSSTSSSGVAEWVIVGIAVVVAIALMAITIVLVVRLNN